MKVPIHVLTQAGIQEYEEKHINTYWEYILFQFYQDFTHAFSNVHMHRHYVQKKALFPQRKSECGKSEHMQLGKGWVGEKSKREKEREKKNKTDNTMTDMPLDMRGKPESPSLD